MFEAQYYEKLDDKKVRCRLCPHKCRIRPGGTGLCFCRFNRAGRLETLTYGRISSLQLDPIEKKPLHFFHPGSMILSIGSLGCNLGCPWCQNWRIAHPKDMACKGLVATEAPDRMLEELTEPLSVAELVSSASEHVVRGNIGVAYTYNEPFVWFEYVLDAAKKVKAQGLKNVLVTNGFVCEEPLKALLPYIDAINIDIKGYSDSFYKKIGGRLSPVLRTARLAKSMCHVEITHLLVTGTNTDRAEFSALVDWIADTLGSDTPLHLSRYFPARRYRESPTPAVYLESAQKIASKRLKSVILGNV